MKEDAQRLLSRKISYAHAIKRSRIRIKITSYRENETETQSRSELHVFTRRHKTSTWLHRTGTNM